MAYKELDDILTEDWNDSNCTTPTIVRGYQYSAFEYTRVVVVERISVADDFMGIISRNKYSVDSHEVWTCQVVSTTEADMNDMVEEIKRIVAAHTPEDDARVLQWQGGDIPLPYGGFRWEYRLVVIKKKSGMVIG